MNLHSIVRKEMKKSGGEARVVKVQEKCRLSQEGQNELKEESAGWEKMMVLYMGIIIQVENIGVEEIQ